MLGIARHGLGQSAAGVACLRSATAIEPYNGLFQTHLAEICRASGLSVEAVTGARKTMARGDHTFAGLPLQENLAPRGTEARCGLIVIDLRNGDTVDWLRVEGPVEELYEVVALPNVVRPMALGFKTDEIRYTVTVEGQPSVWRGVPRP